ncbi:hypothetical protein SAMN06264364_10276 [Quadrisphaera granulorum]|uniref:Uncharacterized protein n=1 Tax=Quadrisphaera granulorum TaxID=317664 RepID=A0A316ADA2_9ACTN|nr:hypothetical protein [Quadrisphaera granulorum]PWJ55713.1 hypothetical protein BXY45_10276 [Quadrisphaera granulorum]SZE95210.1 hypothetical protein SAMN06264364_10276 [Quadrisphaera granulorum]
MDAEPGDVLDAELDPALDEAPLFDGELLPDPEADTDADADVVVVGVTLIDGGGLPAVPASSTLPEKEHPVSDPASTPAVPTAAAHRVAPLRGRRAADPVVVLVTPPR